MPFLIDGHNLIPKLGLHLDSIDDELELLVRMQEFCRVSRAQVEVYFDGAPPGRAATRKAGVVTAHFIHQGSSADAAIEARLLQLKKAARNWTVVSSDGRLKQAASAAQARLMSAEDFVLEMVKRKKVSPAKGKRDQTTSPDEVEAWLRLFEGRGR
jgi:predicted RNA-binding protein with PIN domain